MISLIVSLGLFFPQDTVFKEAAIDEVVVSATVGTGKKAISKGRVASIDEHLGQLSKVEMVRRGNYAWEPVVNNMATERVSTTIDGMKIFYACTDKMDPVTSYVESSNLQRISLNSGLDGNPQATGNIGGSIDLKLCRVGFDAKASEYNALLALSLTEVFRFMVSMLHSHRIVSIPISACSIVMPITTRLVAERRLSSRSSKRPMPLQISGGNQLIIILLRPLLFTI